PLLNTVLSPLSLHDALPICHGSHAARPACSAARVSRVFVTLPLPSPGIDMLRDRFEVTMLEAEGMPPETLKRHIAETDPIGIVGDRKSTRLNSSHVSRSYAV